MAHRTTPFFLHPIGILPKIYFITFIVGVTLVSLAALLSLSVRAVEVVPNQVGMIASIAAGLRPNFTLDVREPIQTMTAYIVQVSMGDTPQESIEYLTVFAVGATLFLISFLFHSASILALRTKFKIT